MDDIIIEEKNNDIEIYDENNLNLIIHNFNLNSKTMMHTIKDKVNTKNLQIVYILILLNSIILLIITLFAEIMGLNFPFDVADLNNWKFQVANILLLLSYTTSNILVLRSTLGLSSVWFIIWGFSFPTGILTDTVMWNYVLSLINFRHAIRLFYKKIPIKFDDNREKIYENMFKGIMSRKDFKILMESSLIRYVKKNRYYSKFKDICSNLSILIHGQIKILKPLEKNHNEEKDEIDNYSNASLDYENKHIYINENEFIDSPEWIMRNTKKRYQVSMLAMKDCTYLMWPHEILIELLKKNPNLDLPLLAVLGIDVSRKLFNQ